MVDAALVVGFWKAVEDCLVEFHDVTRGGASESVGQLIDRLRGVSEASNDRSFSGMIYHEEPWYIACNLSGNELALAQHWSEYQTVLARNGLKRQSDQSQNYRPDPIAR
jgi:hypothetical protein